VTERTRARLSERGIQIVAETESHMLYARDNLIALVERRHDTIGSTGMLTENGLAYLIWRDGQAYLKSKHAEQAATEQQVDAIRRFSQDLAGSL
jgi:hypothetical protein